MDKDTTILAIGSGKGGVGKSTVAANLAVSLSQKGYGVGLLDGDILGYSIPQIMGIKDEKATAMRDKKIRPVEKYGIKIMSMGNLVDNNQPLIWRGPILSGILEQFIKEVHWGPIDFLLLDLPPGTGDIPLSLMQQAKNAKFVIVTTPQITAKDVAKRLGLMAQKTNSEIIGVIENMSYFICDNCNEKHFIFGEGEGKILSKELEVDLLGEIPLLKEIRTGGDLGTIPALDTESVIGKIYSHIGENIIKKLK